MSPRILLIGGHGKIALLMTPLFLKRSWNVTSVIRDPSQKDEILALGKGLPGKVDVLLESLEEVTTEEHARKVLETAKPDWVVWSAGAGGQGGASRTLAVDRDAATHYINASAALPSVTKFLMISYIGSRRTVAPWWTADATKSVRDVNNGALKTYYQAKVAADEALVAAAKKRGSGFSGINLRPGTLKDGDATGKVSLGKTDARGEVKRSEVAEVTARLLANDNIGTRWVDLLQGEEDVDKAVERIVKDGVDSYDGEGSGEKL